MTELQIGLIALGGTAVVGVFAYNKWQEYRHRKLAEAVFQPHHDDVLLGDAPKPARKVEAAVRHEPEIRVDEPVAPVERIEPMFVDAPQATEPEPEPQSEPRYPAVDPAPAPSPEIDSPFAADQEPEPLPVVEEEQPLQSVPVPAELLDPRLEFVVAMDMVEAVSASQILHSQREYLQRLSKPVHWLGFNERTREWERLPPDSNLPVRRLRVGLQLVNRLGPVSEGDFTLFTNAMQALADELMAVADMPDIRVLDQAAEIDRFCAAVDLEIGINLVSRASAFSGTKIRALAEAAGMVLGIDGLFTRYDDEGRPQFSLQNYETAQFTPDTVRTLSTHGLTFLLDVPRVDHGERVFMQMTELAKRFAETLQGALVDDNRQPLSDSQLEHIRREFIGKPQATMASFGLSAGSAQALRLFS
ncbi:cell division protein FtsZ [Dechloromonas denitrificans]|uniref:cell division protein ZipA C-terminal FtsZ-binding domain-containing protein n=1 Tax=Dechloromonas denitrificans TaxID=281362 RepID=UPI001CF8F581|nr:cell division protein ZipA C-terminal FtsZ-binding domain-containing protein [Dechloromonas denitrificans]UCV13014.1 cell division protein FtsZ [Dechloromonas denitrificans]